MTETVDRGPDRRLKTMRYSEHDEWLEADGLGGFASGTAAGVRTRRYHALLLTATTPPTGRMVLVNGFDAWIETRAGQARTDVAALRARRRPSRRRTRIWRSPSIRGHAGRLARGRHDNRARDRRATRRALVALSWRVLDGSRGTSVVRPFFSGRDYHSMHRENGAFGFDPSRRRRSASSGSRTTAFLPFMSATGSITTSQIGTGNFRYEAERGADSTRSRTSPRRASSIRISTHAEAALIFCAAAAGRDGALAALRRFDRGGIETAHVVCLAPASRG